jgi:Ca2+-binding RTX toxin-like protein
MGGSNKGAGCFLAVVLTVASAITTATPAAAQTARCLGATATIVGTDGNDVLTGTSGRDVIVGLRGDDVIAGRGGNDLICAGAGLDAIKAGSGSDRVRGSGGVDLIAGGSGRDHLYGSNKSDILIGGPGRDVLKGGPGNDLLQGGTGSDHLDGGRGALDVASFAGREPGVNASLATGVAHGQGSDRLANLEGLFGSAGNDRLVGNSGRNVLIGSWGNDTLVGGRGFDLVLYPLTFGLSTNLGAEDVQLNNKRAIKAYGVDQLAGFEGAEGGTNLIGNAGDNLLIGTLSTRVKGRGGNDTLIGGLTVGTPTLQGGRGNDKLIAIVGSTYLDGGPGNDVIHGLGETNILDYGKAPRGVDVNLPGHTATGYGHDTVRGTFDWIVGSKYNDTLVGGRWTADIWGSSGDDVIDATRGYGVMMDGSGGNDVITGNGTLVGGAGNDRLTGGPYPDRIQGGPGSDSMFGHGASDELTPDDDPAGSKTIDPGNDVVNGGAGVDNVEYLNSNGPMTIDLSAGTAQGEGSDSLSNIENVSGSGSYGNTIRGTAGDNRIDGGNKNDSLFGLAGNDVLDGSSGTDALDGGSGTDSCWYGEQDTNCETFVGNSASLNQPGVSTLRSSLPRSKPTSDPARTMPTTLQPRSSVDNGRLWAKTVAKWARWLAR